VANEIIVEMSVNVLYWHLLNVIGELQKIIDKTLSKIKNL